MHKIVHVSFAFAGVPKILDLEPVFSMLATDWIRYANNCWLLWTDKEASEIYFYVQYKIDKSDNVLIAPVDPSDFYGRLPTWAWEWLKTKGVSVDYGHHIDQALMAKMLGGPTGTK